MALIILSRRVAYLEEEVKMEFDLWVSKGSERGEAMDKYRSLKAELKEAKEDAEEEEEKSKLRLKKIEEAPLKDLEARAKREYEKWIEEGSQRGEARDLYRDLRAEANEARVEAEEKKAKKSKN